MLYRDEADALRRAIQEALDRWPDGPEKEALRKARRDTLSMTFSETRAQASRAETDFNEVMRGRAEISVDEYIHRTGLDRVSWTQEYQQVPPPLEPKPDDPYQRLADRHEAHTANVRRAMETPPHRVVVGTTPFPGPICGANPPHVPGCCDLLPGHSDHHHDAISGRRWPVVEECGATMRGRNTTFSCTLALGHPGAHADTGFRWRDKGTERGSPA